MGLIFIEYSGRNKHGGKLALYKCDCSNTVITEVDSVKKGLTNMETLLTIHLAT